MKAVQITGLEEMAVVELEKPEIKSNEVLLKMNYVGFCGSDLSTFLGKNPMVKMPVVPGHEVSAVIEAVGDEVPDVLKPGMLVLTATAANVHRAAAKEPMPVNTTRRSACSVGVPCANIMPCPGRK